MDEEERKFKTQWEATRNQGRILYAIKEALIKGSVFALAIELTDATIYADHYIFNLNRNLLRLTIFIGGYFLYGLWKWNKNEKRFAKSKNTSSPSGDDTSPGK